MKKLKVRAIVLGLILIAVGSVYWDYHVWSLKHPDAPVWTYFF
jgi:hypothetical protein